MKAQLTRTQYGVYLDSVSNPETTLYNLPFLQKIAEDTELEALKDAAVLLQQAHPALRCRVSTDEQGNVCLEEGDIIPLEIIETDNEPDKNALVRPFDLEKGPLARFEVYSCKGSLWYFQDIHHLICDGSSMNIISQDLAQAYAGKEPLPEENTLADVSEAEEQARKTGEFEDQKNYYEKLLAGYDPDSAPLPMSEDKEIAQGWINESFELNEDALQRLKKEGITSPGAFFTSVMGFVTAKFNYTKNSVISTIWHGRDEERVKNTVGMFVKTIPFVTDFAGETDPESFLRSGARQLAESRKRTLYSFADMAAELGAVNEVMFVYQGELINFSIAQWSGGESEWIFDPAHIEETKISMDVRRKSSGKYQIHFGYRKDFYTAEFAGSFVKAYINAARSFLAGDDIKDIKLTDVDEIKLLDSFNNTETPYDDKTTVVELFEKAAKRFPDKDAVIFKEKHISYKEADTLTDKIAAKLREIGVCKEKVVGVLIPRNENIVICSMGVLKSGGAYLPMDPTYPAERLNLMLEDSGAVALIADPSLKHLVSEQFKGTVIGTDELEALPECSSALPLPAPEDLFVMLYTSGTTGKPKGVMYTHGNMMALCAYVRRVYELDENSVASQYASYGFDACTFDLYPTLSCGGCVCVVPEEIRLDLGEVFEYFKANKVTNSIMTTQMGRQFAALGNTGYLKFVSCGGEKLASMDPPDYRFFNAYGPSEVTVMTTCFEVNRRCEDIPIGKPLDNLKLYIVDTEGNRLPVGAAGELWASGPQVTRGYLNRPEKTAESYGSNPFSEDMAYGRIFKTGDVVRYLPDGNIQFVGRHDGQVKIRGFRIELTEVEEVIRRFPGVKDAVAAAFDNPAGGKFLAAYVVSEGKLDVKALEEFIRTEKPPYMVPAVTMQIEAVPYTQNHKVNRRALPLPEWKAGDITAPENSMQQKIFDLTAEILGHRGFGIDTGIFEAGLSSIGLTQLGILLGKEFNTPIKIADLKTHDTVRKIEKLILEGSENSAMEILPDYPISQTQKGIFVESSKGKDNLNYNIPMLFRLDDRVDTDRLEQAIKTALNAHPYIKTTLFAGEGGEVRARRNDDAEVFVENVMIREVPGPEELVRPFRLLENQLYRAAIYRSGKGNYLFMDFHHIISDGFSEGILISDINRAYAGEILEKETFTGFEAALDEEEGRKGERYEKAREYYDGLFADFESETLPPKDPESSEAVAGAFNKTISADAAKIEEFCKENQVSANAFFNAAFGFALSRFVPFENVTYTTVYNGRNDSRLSNSFTMLVKTLPVMVKTEENRSILKLLKETQEQLLSSMANDIYSFAEISAAYGLHSDILFVYQGDNFNFDSLCGYPAEFINIQPDVAKAGITILVNLKEGRYDLRVEYRKDLYSRAFMENLVGAIDMAAGEFLRREELADISLVSESARAAIDRMNDTERPFENIPAHKFFERYAAVQPGKTAVIGSGKELTYGELNRLSNRIAHALMGLGVKKDSIVGMFLERTVEVSEAELGILKAGGAFLGILPSYPDERVEFCLRDAESTLVVTTKEIRASRPELFAPDKPYKAVAVEELLECSIEDDPDIDISPDSLCYCIYTSGTTGTPKGVMLEHHCLANFARQDDHVPGLYYGNKGGNISLTMSSNSFDMSLLEHLLFLLNGRTVCIATENEVHNPAALAELIKKYNIDAVSATPSFYTNYLDIPQYHDALKDVRSIMAAAEPFPGNLYNRLHEAAPNAAIVNGYGPSECTICSSIKHVVSDKKITVGAPLANVKYYTMDRFGNILPPYACGELIICGEGVGRGYIKLPEKNAASYFEIEGVRAYHSGDLARINDDGEAECLGRLDDQVKLRGFRIELGEIERRMTAFEGIKQSKVVVRNNGSEDYLAGFFVAEKKIDIGELTSFLKATLNYYMVPDVMMQLDAMPLTPNGKVDKKALPEVKKEKKQGGRKAPKKSLEQKITELFASVLNLEEVYADDDFFEIGGTSLSASKVVMQLMSEGIKVDYQNIFEHPTPEGLAEFIEGSGAEKPGEPVRAEKKSLVESEFEDVLACNIPEKAADVARSPLGDVLLTGGVGFLGIHVFKELLDKNEGKIICLIRHDENSSSERRLKRMLMYYFGETFDDMVNERVTAIDADITDDSLAEKFKDVHFDTIINCAAIVKHYASDDTIETVNVHGVENMIFLAREHDARLIQISTVSIPGVHTEESYKNHVSMFENQLFVIESGDNKYLLSKYHAEQKIFAAVREGLNAKVIRVGNLMGRHSDGEFQINFNTNAFLAAFKGFVTIGKWPVGHATDPVSFSPIDLTAKAIVLLAGTNREFTAFNAENRITFDELHFVEALKKSRIKLETVSDEEYYEEYYRMLGDDKINSALSGLLTNDKPGIHMAKVDTTFTANILYRLGFSWPLVDSGYLEKVVESLDSLDFFN